MEQISFHLWKWFAVTDLCFWFNTPLHHFLNFYPLASSFLTDKKVPEAAKFLQLRVMRKLVEHRGVEPPTFTMRM